MQKLKIKIALIVLLLFVCPPIKAQADKKASALEPNKSIEQELAAGQTYAYQIKTDKGQFLHVVIDQKSADVAVALFSPDGAKVLEADNPNIARGPEQIFFITTAAGIHRLEISPKETGRVETKIESLRSATAQDRNRIDAERAFIEGEKLSASSAHAQAITKYEEALYRLIDSLSDQYDKATILYSLGKSYKTLGDSEKSLDYFHRSLALFQTAGSWDEIFKDLRPLYAFMGGKQQTLDYLAGALPLVRALKNQRLEAILLTGLTKVCEDMNQLPQALDYNQQALALFRITGKRGAQAFTLTEISDADLSLEDKKKAVDYLNQALLLARGASDRALEVSLLMGIGYIYASIDEHQTALNYFRQTLPLWRGLKDKNGEAYTLNFIGSTYLLLGEYQLAREYFENALALFRETGDMRAEAYAVSYLGVAESRSGDTQKAFDYFQKALRVFREAGEKGGEAYALSFLAEIYWNRGATAEALENYQKSLSIWNAAGSGEGGATALSNLGLIHLSLGETERASNYFGRALPLFRLSGNRSGEAVSLYGLARVSYARGNLEESLAKIEAAINIVESLRTKIASTELRASYLATYRHLFEFYIELLMQLNKKKPSQGFDALALRASERARMRSLLDILTDARADIRQGVDPALLERERALQKQLNAKDEARRRARSPQQADALDREIQTLTSAYQDLQAEIRQKSPRYSALMQPQPVGAKEIQQMLDPETLLLEYSLGDENSYLWVVSQNSIKTFSLPKRKEIEAKALLFYEAARNAETAEAAKKAVSDLSKILITPAAARELGNKRLLIVADGALQYIPFAALSVVADNTEQPLIASNEIVYLPSASTLAVLRDEAKERQQQKTAAAAKTIVVLADPVFDPGDTRVKPDEAAIQNTKGEVPDSIARPPLKKALRDVGLKDNSLPRLPGTRREAMTILSFVSEPERKQAMDFEASRATAVSPELGQYRIIHLATHGLINNQHPELSGIVFSLVDERGNPQDGFLRLHEIFNLKLPADLIVLSACKTALGKDTQGEGLIGLTRGFMYAGAQRVVASLWSVDDRATFELMKLFYQGMLGEKKLRPAAALREAQIAMWKTKRFSAPFYWSAFTIQGEWR